MTEPVNLTQLGGLIDELYQLREQRLLLTRQADELKAQETALRGQIMATMQTAGLTGGRGQLATAGLKTNTVPTVRDWAALHQYIIANDAWDLMQQRVSSTACAARWLRQEVVPGVEAFEVADLSLSRASR